MTAARFIPAPCCKGRRGEFEPVPGLWGEGPYYPCPGCDDTGNLADYLRVQAADKAKFAREDAVTCECGHKAWFHYEGTARCAWLSEEPIDAAGHLEICACEKSRETVMAPCQKAKAL
jgi:hypothetical protein